MTVGKVLPTEACCAVGPDGKIDIDLVRRNQASAHSAAGNVHGLPWPRMVAQGWRVVSVRIVAISEWSEEPAPTELPKPRKPRRLPPDPPLPESYSLTDAEYVRLTATMAGKVPMLRCGDKRR